MSDIRVTQLHFRFGADSPQSSCFRTQFGPLLRNLQVVCGGMEMALSHRSTGNENITFG